MDSDSARAGRSSEPDLTDESDLVADPSTVPVELEDFPALDPAPAPFALDPGVSLGEPRRKGAKRARPDDPRNAAPHHREEALALFGHRPNLNPPHAVAERTWRWNLSTIWFGNIPITERTDRAVAWCYKIISPCCLACFRGVSLRVHVAQVPSFYVRCPLHGTSLRSCTKSMQTNQPDKETVVLRLIWWLVEGALFLTGPPRRSHVVSLQELPIAICHVTGGHLTCGCVAGICSWPGSGFKQEASQGQSAEEQRRRHVRTVWSLKGKRLTGGLGPSPISSQSVEKPLGVGFCCLCCSMGGDAGDARQCWDAGGAAEAGRKPPSNQTQSLNFCFASKAAQTFVPMWGLTPRIVFGF